MNQRVEGDRPAREDRDAILAAVVIERAPERDMEAGALGEDCRLVHVARAPRALVDLLEQHDIRPRLAHERGDTVEVVDPCRVLACMDVVDEDAHRPGSTALGSLRSERA